MRRRFDLLRYFALLSFAVVTTIGVISAVLIGDFLAENLLERDAVVSQNFLQSRIEAEDDPQIFVESHSNIETFDLQELNYIATIPDVVRANFYAPSGQVIWSTNRDLVGRKFSFNKELEEALNGRLVFEVKDLTKEDKAEHIQFGTEVVHAVENYLPIWDKERRRVVAVIEMYKTPINLFTTIAGARKLVAVGAVVAGLFLYVVLFWIVYHADNLIQRQHDKLVEAETMAAVGEMAAAVAHSIRNPLAAIRSSAEIALESSTDAVTHETSEDIIIEADRLGQRLRELLIFSCPGAVRFQPISLGSVIDDCLDGFARRLERQFIRLKSELQEPLPYINGDTSLLSQLFNSLIANAIEAMPEGGTLSIKPNITNGGRAVEISIADTGYGIPPDRLEQIFEIRTTTKRGGLGVGLTLVRRIVERHGGTINIQSELGRGTIVNMAFPVELNT